MFNTNTAPEIAGSNVIDNPTAMPPSSALDTDDPVRTAIRDATGEDTGVAPVQIVEIHPLPNWMRTEFEMQRAANGKYYARPRAHVLERYTKMAPELYGSLYNWLPDQTDTERDYDEVVKQAANAGIALGAALAAAQAARTLDPADTTEAERCMRADLDRVGSKAGWLLMGKNELAERADYLRRTNTPVASDQRFTDRKTRFCNDALGFIVEFIACREAYGRQFIVNWDKGVKNALWFKANQHNRPQQGTTEANAELTGALASSADLLGF